LKNNPILLRNMEEIFKKLISLSIKALQFLNLNQLKKSQKFC